MAKKVEERPPENEASVIVNLVSRLIQQSVERGASDIHIEPEGDIVRVRYRVDGILREIESHPHELLDSIVSRVKILADLDITERKKPQDGRLRIRWKEKDLDLRVSVIPTVFGENVALRILDKSRILFGVDHLGLTPPFFDRFLAMIRKPYGIIFVTGPNGSGKTTTIYSALNTINSVEKNIVTLEDPVEYQLPYIRQTQIEPDSGVSFATGLRYLLRQDPDVILVGEIRDSETAEIAIRAGLTGHLVLTTLHTNNSVGAIARLSDMNIESVLIASATIGALAQRLVRVACPHCKTRYRAPIELLEELNLLDEKNVEFVRANGCDRCSQSGYLGRTAIFELLVVDDDLRQLIVTRAPYEKMMSFAKQRGMRTLRMDGIEKALQGITTVEEVLRVTGSEMQAVTL